LRSIGDFNPFNPNDLGTAVLPRWTERSVYCRWKPLVRISCPF
jgi:hypothetical protein